MEMELETTARWSQREVDGNGVGEDNPKLCFFKPVLSNLKWIEDCHGSPAAAPLLPVNDMNTSRIRKYLPKDIAFRLEYIKISSIKIHPHEPFYSSFFFFIVIHK